MADLHSQLAERCIDRSKFPIPASSWETFRNSETLDGVCVDYMVEMLCRAVGSKMAGKEGRRISELLTHEISVDPPAQQYVVLGVSKTETSLRVSGANNDPAPILSVLVGKANVRQALAGRLDPLNAKNLLLIQSRANQTSLVELARDCISGSSGERSLRWTLRMYDTLNTCPTLDSDLENGINSLLEETGLKPLGAEIEHTRPLFIQQKNEKVGGLMTFLHLGQKLTGEELDPVHWDLFVDLVRIFFDLWIFHEAEFKGAIRPCYLRLGAAACATATSGGGQGGAAAGSAGEGTNVLAWCRSMCHGLLGAAACATATSGGGQGGAAAGSAGEGPNVLYPEGLPYYEVKFSRPELHEPHPVFWDDTGREVPDGIRVEASPYPDKDTPGLPSHDCYECMWCVY
jgi:hypothetical protein